MGTEHELEALLQREAEAANLEAEADWLDGVGNPGRAAVLREQARRVRAVRYTVPKSA